MKEPPPPDLGGVKTFDNPLLRLSQESASLDDDESADVSMVQLRSTEKTGLSTTTLKYDDSLGLWSRYDEKLGEWTILCQEAEEEADKRRKRKKKNKKKNKTPFMPPP